jgi:predicted nucleic acid-binding protein
MKLLDTTFLIDILNGKKETLPILKSNIKLFTTQLNMYEVIRGMYLKGISKEKFTESVAFFESIYILPLDDNSILRSAEISSSLIKEGKEISNIDCLTAGIALTKGITTIVTKNARHFSRIKGIKAEEY